MPIPAETAAPLRAVAAESERSTAARVGEPCLEMIRRMVAFETVSRDSNRALIEWTRGWLEQHGAKVTITWNDERSKANLFGTLAAGDGNATHGGVVLSGHTDVVPVDGQPWSTPPFEATRAGSRIYGRGCADMKSFFSIALALLPHFRQRRLARPLHFALSYDEEVGCIGVRRLIADVLAQGLRPAGCIVGEPTGMEVITAHKGRSSWRCRVRGHEAHSALAPQGVNAVEVACELVADISAQGRRFRDTGPYDSAYDVPYTTVHVGTIRGGTALNIVPRDCEFEFEMRHLPADDPGAFIGALERRARALTPAMHAVDPATYVAFDALSTTTGFDTTADSPIVALAQRCSEDTACGKVSFGSEAGLFDGAGIATVLCGPGHIAQAHQPDEWIGLDQLARCEAFMLRLADELAAG
ncbi:MAG: acetylornithine deacetylase [Proteobacteria bacterium]|nr:acetylornithine deacetylase [Pseudomonadota bacterium]